MRETDTSPLSRAVDDMQAGNRSQAREFHAVEGWRDALLAGDEAQLEDMVALAPEEERAEVRSRIRLLARNARAEAAKNKPPRSSRALFRLLRELRAGVGAGVGAEAGADEAFSGAVIGADDGADDYANGGVDSQARNDPREGARHDDASFDEPGPDGRVKARF